MSLAALNRFLFENVRDYHHRERLRRDVVAGVRELVRQRWTGRLLIRFVPQWVREKRAARRAQRRARRIMRMHRK